MALRHDICRWPCTWIKLHNTHISHAINFIISMSIFLYNDVQSSAVVTRSNIVRYCINDWRTQEEYQSDGGPTKDTEHFALKVRAMVFWENFWENWPRYNGSDLLIRLNWGCVAVAPTTAPVPAADILSLAWLFHESACGYYRRRNTLLILP